MAIGFRKSLFGFNTGDVIKYIETSHTKHAQKEADLSKQLDAQRSELEELNKKYNDILTEKSEIERKLQEYDEKYEEINRLSENIGKLYLVAQANAQAIMKNSAEASELVNIEVERNLSSIVSAQESLTGIKQDLLETTSSFSSRISELISSLNNTRNKITDNNTDSEKHTEEFNSVYEMITK